jgi:hypothetical protein
MDVRGKKVSKRDPCKNGLHVSVDEPVTNLIAKSRVSSQLKARTAEAVYQTLLLETTGNKIQLPKPLVTSLSQRPRP